jgi:BlaI family penicillinase repressor
MMAAKEVENLGPLQATVLCAVWDLGGATIHQVIEELEKDHRPFPYTTILSTMQKLEKAGWIKHKKKDRRFFYTATVGKKKAVNQAIKRIARRLFGGKPLGIVRQILEIETFSEEEARKVCEILDRKQAGCR